MLDQEVPQLARDFCKFNDGAKSPYHAVQQIVGLLKQGGFSELSEKADWRSAITPGGKYYVIRNGTTVLAFSVDPSVNSAASNRNSRANARASDDYPAFCILAAHTDSPCFKLKPISAKSAYGYAQVGVECYGGGLWHTWFDRDLTVAGRVIVREETGGPPNRERLVKRLVEIPRPVLRIPNLAIHLSRNVNVEGFKVNKESDTTPIIATQLAMEANKTPRLSSTANGDVKHTKTEKEPVDKLSPPLSDRHPPILLQLIAEQLNIDASQIVDLDLCVADTQPASIGGALNEFLNAPRLDNLASCFTGCHALLNATTNSAAAKKPIIRVLACFDHEEVGSTSLGGADSVTLPALLQRIAGSLSLDFDRAISRSFLISADMAHAVHPNYSSKHEAKHRPALGAGLVIKTNQNQRYATNGISGYVIREAARQCNAPVQEFVVPNDKPCGSTVGPYLASKTGVLTVDVGQPQLAMHSVREVCSTHDFEPVVKLFTQVMSNHIDIVESLDEA